VPEPGLQVPDLKHALVSASDLLECQSPGSKFRTPLAEYRSRRKESLYTTDSDWEELNVSRNSSLLVPNQYFAS
jgi:hypothetical protein